MKPLENTLIALGKERFNLAPNKFEGGEEFEEIMKRITEKQIKTNPMQAIGNDGQWHEWEELSQDERDAWMESMTEADRRHDYYKTHEKPHTLKQQLLDYETDHRIC